MRWGLDEESTAVVEAAFDGAAEKLGADPVVLAVGELIDAYDALFIVAGRNDRQVRAIAEEIERRAALRGLRAFHEEGWDDGQWVALDYGGVIIHVFDETTRAYYDLEHLWNAAPAFRATA